MSTPAPTDSTVANSRFSPNANREIKLVSHSPLFYWWPVWAFGFAMALFTYLENHRMAIVPAGAEVTRIDAAGSVRYEFAYKEAKDTKSLENALKVKGVSSEPAFPTRVSQHAWVGSVYVLILLLTIAITNVPLRGMWSFAVLMILLVIGLFITVFHGWDEVFSSVQSLRVYINLAGYLTISTVVFLIWAGATFGFDRQAYIIFTPGQIKVCEHIGDSVKTYDTVGVTFEKQRDDLFRHYILGFGSGDLIVRTSGADRQEIKMTNVLGIGWKLKPIENMLRERPAAV